MLWVFIIWAILIELKDYKNAKDLFKKALSINPNYGSAHSNLGTVYRELGRIKEAISCFKKALKIDPENPNYYYNIGNILQDAEQIE